MTKNRYRNNIVDKFSGILIIPLKNDAPVLVFKSFGRPFFEGVWELGIRNGPELRQVFTGDDWGVVCEDDEELMTSLNDYEVSWKGEFLGHGLPEKINYQYKDFFTQSAYHARRPERGVSDLPIGAYEIQDLPIGAIELSIKIVLGDKDMKIFSPKYITPVRNALRKLCILQEKRGKEKKPDKTSRQLRAFITKEYKSLKNKTGFVKILQRRLEKEVDKLFSGDADKAEQYYWSDATIRRIVKACIKK